VQLFIDNDILLKLGSADLLQNLNKIFNVNNSSIFILPTAKHYIAGNKKLKEKYSKEILNEILKKIDCYLAIPDEYLNQDVYIKLLSIPKVDSGEQILYSLRPPSNDFLILTGDKLSIKALYSNHTIKDIVEQLRNKIVCLEYIFLKLLDLESFESLSKRVMEANYCGDKTILIVFGQPSLSIELVRAGLLSYFKNLDAETDKSLFK
jgi:hypothetical protein